FAPDSRRLATSREYGALHVWDATADADPLELAGFVTPVYTLTFVGPDRFAAAGRTHADASGVRLWSLPDGKLRRDVSVTGFPASGARAGRPAAVPERRPRRARAHRRRRP